MGAPDIFFTGFGKTEIAHLTSTHEVCYGSRDILDRDVGINPVLVEKVYVIGLQAPQRSLGRLADMLGPAISAHDLAVFDAKAELCSNHGAFALPFYRSSDELFIDERAVDLGRV